MSKDFVTDTAIEAPDVKAEFERASVGAEKKVPAKAKPALELKPPGPAPMGMGSDAGLQVSPQLRGEQEQKKLNKAMLMAREFRRVSRDAFER